MFVPMFTVKHDFTPHDQLQLLDAWEAWGISLDQKWDWIIQLFGPNHIQDLSGYLASEALATKSDQLELPLDLT